jgi:hypothetical protein
MFKVELVAPERLPPSVGLVNGPLELDLVCH